MAVVTALRPDAQSRLGRSSSVGEVARRAAKSPTTMPGLSRVDGTPKRGVAGRVDGGLAVAAFESPSRRQRGSRR